MIAAVYFKIQTLRDLKDLSKEYIKYGQASNKSLRSNQVKVRPIRLPSRLLFNREQKSISDSDSDWTPFTILIITFDIGIQL